jgi:hypothetical protein
MIYSPSQTALWLDCRMKRALSRHGWRLKVAGKRDLAAILGTAVAAGLATYNCSKFGCLCEPGVGEFVPRCEHCRVRAGDFENIINTSRQSALEALNDLHSDGRHVAEYDVAQRDALTERAARVVARYIAADPIPPEWPILAVETPCDESGARPDLVVDDGRGPAPIDYKVKLALKREYEAREIARWRDSWQLYHYASRVCRPGAYHYYICLIVCEPFRVELLPFEIADETMAWWRESAARYWRDMAQDAALEVMGDLPPMAAKHADEFGECEFRRACFDHRLDKARMAQDYVRVERRR